MTNLFDYISWRGDLTFGQAPLCTVDLLIFSEIVHAPFENLTPGFKGKTLLELSGKVYPEPVKGNPYSLLPARYRIWELMKKHPRFAQVRLMEFVSHFEPENSKQFAGAVFCLDRTAVVVFRGTDSTITGWKEDFLMSFESPIPAQEDALQFLGNVSPEYDQIYVCGHSKGGNLAMYAASRLCNKARICGVVSFDGPGLDQEILNSDGWKEILPVTRLIIPESSVIGLLLGYYDKYEVIASDSISLMQHNPFYWHVTGSEFEKAPETTFSSRVTENALHNFLARCPVAQRKILVQAIFDILEATGAKATKDIIRSVPTHLGQIKKVVECLDDRDKDTLKEMFRILKQAYGSSIKLNMQPK